MNWKLFPSEVSASCAARVLAALCTHHRQAQFALPVGSIGSQDGDHHCNSAHDVDAIDPSLHLEAEKADRQFHITLLPYQPRWDYGSILQLVKMFKLWIVNSVAEDVVN